MKIYYTISDFKKLDNAIVTSGTFDGVHVGHQKIINHLKALAAANNGESVVITYWPHPRLILNPSDDTLKLLSTFDEKANLLREYGIQHLLRIPFTKDFSQLSSQTFIKSILVDAIGTKKLVIGYDHRFGNNREGSFDELKINGPTYGFEVQEIERLDVDHIAVSSSKIRKALAQHDIDTANHFLGRPYSLSGKIIEGDRLGRVLGYPTANISLDFPYKLIPADGVYAATAQLASNTYKGMLYIGNRPTINGSHRVIELHLFNFNKNIYNENITVFIQQFIRPDATFTNLEILKNRLNLDKLEADNFLKNIVL